MPHTPGIPSLPTDNLYKFIAIFGLILFVLSTLTQTFFITEFSDQRLNVRLDRDSIKRELTKDSTIYAAVAIDIRKHIAEHGVVVQQIDSQSTQLINILTDSLKGKSSKLNYTIIQSRKDSLEAVKKMLEEKIDHSDSEYNKYSKLYLKADLDYKLMDIHFDTVDSKYDFVRKFGYVGYTIGLILTVIGCVAWYTKHQIYIDLKLKAESNVTVPDWDKEHNRSYNNFDVWVKSKIMSIPYQQQLESGGKLKA